MTEVRHKSKKLISAKPRKTCILDTTSSYLPVPISTNLLLKSRANGSFLALPLPYGKATAPCSCYTFEVTATGQLSQLRKFATKAKEVKGVANFASYGCRCFTTTTSAITTTNTRSVKPEGDIKSQQVVKKRLSAIFNNYQLIIIWASIEPIAKKIWRKVFFNDKTVKTDSFSNGRRNQEIADSCFATTLAFPLLTLKEKQEGKVKQILNLQNIKFGKLPKDTLNNHCTNINFPMIGCGIDYLAVKHLDTSAIKNYKAPFKSAPELQHFEYERVVQQAASLRKPDVENYSNSRSSNAHQIAAILAVLSNTDKINQKLLRHPSQLLGAFIQNTSNSSINAKGNVKLLSSPFTAKKKYEETKTLVLKERQMIFIGGYELRQSLILEQTFSLAVTPSAAQPLAGLQLYSGIAISVKKVIQKPLRCIYQSVVQLNKLLTYSAKKSAKLLPLRLSLLTLISLISLVASQTKNIK